jgi:hypothetical protein
MRIEAIAQRAIDALEAAGWTIVASDSETTTFTRSEVGTVAYDLNLLVEERSYGTWFNPTIGVYDEQVSQLATTFMGLPASRTTVVGATLADLLYEEGHANAPTTRWIIESEAEVDPVIALLVKDIEDYGFLFLRSFTSRDDLIEALAARERSQLDTGYLAILHAVSGQEQEAVSRLVEFRDQPDGELSAISAGFVDSFVAHFKLHGKLPSK